MHRETYPAKWWRDWREEEKELQEEIQQYHGPALSCLCCELSSVSALSCPSRRAAHVLLYPPKRLKCCRLVGTELRWDPKHHHAASPLSFNHLLPRNLSPTCSHWFRTITLLQNVSVLRSGRVHVQAHTPTSHWHTAGIICHHNSILPLQC